jgi:hypothetical protein
LNGERVGLLKLERVYAKDQRYRSFLRELERFRGEI